MHLVFHTELWVTEEMDLVGYTGLYRQKSAHTVSMSVFGQNEVSAALLPHDTLDQGAWHGQDEQRLDLS